MSSFVVDASAVSKLLVEEPGTEQARSFFSRLADPDPPVIYAPDLLYAECANTVWKYVSHHRYAPQQAQAALDALGALALQVIPTQLLFQEAFRLGLRFRITVYDACYLALAQRLRCPLVTEDKDLARRVRPLSTVALSSLADVGIT